MNQTLQKDIKALNELSLVRYLTILGYTPVHSGDDSTLYRMYLDQKDLQDMLIDHEANEFIDIAGNRKGNLVDFACLLFGITPEELCSNIMPYRIDLLMRQHTPQEVIA